MKTERPTSNVRRPTSNAEDELGRESAGETPRLLLFLDKGDAAAAFEPRDFHERAKNSGFFSTTLETLLRYLGSETLILTGISRQFLRPFYRKRRLHARLQTDHPLGLHCFKLCRREQAGARAHAEIFEGGHAPVSEN